MNPNFGFCHHNCVRDERGSVAILFSLMLLPIILAVGLAVDFSRSARAHSEMQNSLDAAAIAALKAEPAIAEQFGVKFFMANFKSDLVTTPVVNIRLDGSVGVTATARGSMPLLFGGLIGAETQEISTSSTVMRERTVVETQTETVVIAGGAPCLHVMDQSAQQALDIADSTDIDASSCDVRVRSNRSEAMRARGSKNIKFRSVGVKGQSSTDGGVAVTGWPYTISDDAEIVANPYLDAIRDGVQSIVVGSCTTANTGKTWTGTVLPGTYCGDTVFDGVTFEPGLYIIKSSSGNKNGALSFSGQVTGDGVTFYLADNKSTFKSYEATANSTLVAPTTGITQGILFFENSNRGSNWDLKISNVTAHTWQGLAYLPSANLTFDEFSAWKSFKVSLAANTVTITSWSSMVWEPFVWYPFNQTAPILYDNTTYSDETITVTEKPIYIAQ